MPEYTPQEAAVLADANLRTVQKAITEKRIPVRKKSGRRLVDEKSVVTIAVTASLPADWKISTKAIKKLLEPVVVRVEVPVGYPGAVMGDEVLKTISLGKKGAWTFNVAKIVPVVQERMALYEKAKEKLIERNPEILGGTPVIRSTRLNVYAIAARLEGGDTMEELLAEYPYVTREQLEAARLYAKANPLRGRPGGRPWLKKKSRKS